MAAKEIRAQHAGKSGCELAMEVLRYRRMAVFAGYKEMLARAVVISGDERVLRVAESALPKARFELTMAHRTEDLAETLLAVSPQLVILDLDLPGNRAAGILRWIREQRPQPALVVVSSSESLSLLREGFVVPDFQLLIKPLGLQEMKQALARGPQRIQGVSSEESP